MKQTLDTMIRIKNTAALLEPVDLLIKNVRVVNTLTQEIHEADLGITQGMIVSFAAKEAKEVIDGEGRYVAPLLMDCHMHIESTLLTPKKLSDFLVVRGVGTVVADPHEIANVAGVLGIQYILDSVAGLPLTFKVMLPSCVPSSKLENAGAVLQSKDLRPFYENPYVGGLAEVMDYFAVLQDDDMLQKILDAKSYGKTVDGHGSILDNTGFDVFASLGISNDHEAVDQQGAIERLRRGIYTFVREGTVTNNLRELMPVINEKNYRRVCFCTDDKHPDHLMKDGGIDGVLRMAIREGMDPIMALTICTLNAAESYRIHDEGAVAPGFKANFFLFDDLQDIQAQQVFKEGKRIALNGKLMVDGGKEAAVPQPILESIHYKPFGKEDLQLHLNGHMHLRMLQVKAGNVITKLAVEEVDLENDCFVPSVARNHAKLAVIERHHQTGNIGLCGVLDFGLKEGAIATTVAHDSHNMIVIGMNDEDMLIAVERVKTLQGGYVVVADGAVLAEVPLKIGGLMTDASIEESVAVLADLHHKVQKIMIHHDFNPLLMLSFVSLAVIPDVKLTDMGLVDVHKGTILTQPV